MLQIRVSLQIGQSSEHACPLVRALDAELRWLFDRDHLRERGKSLQVELCDLAREVRELFLARLTTDDQETLRVLLEKLRN